jgi:GWxTD domain-containing protein
MRRVLAASLLLLLVALHATAEDLQPLFMKAKEQFRLAAYAEALKTLDKLQAASERPGNEAYRAQMAPGLTFYKGACLAALGRADEAREQFELYLTYQPNPSLDPSLYPRRVIAALDEARKGMRRQVEKPAEGGSLAASYRAFPQDASASFAGMDESWAEGPARYLLTAQQKDDFARLSDPVSRSEFISEFWRVRDPHPETPENEFREEFERRVAFADARLEQNETRGSLTDRGMVFVLLGPPTWAGRKPIAIGEDTADPVGMSRFTSADLVQALKGASSNAQAAAIVSEMTGPGNTLPESDTSWREIWHYRRELLPSGVSYQQVDFDFISKKGYGTNVLQRDSLVLTTIEAAKSAGRSGVLARKAEK